MWGEELTLNLFGMTILGSVIVAAVVEKLKVWLKTKGWLNTALALGTGVLLGGVVFLIQLLLVKIGMVAEGIPLLAALVQGLFSGGIAAGLWKAVRTLGKKH